MRLYSYILFVGLFLLSAKDADTREYQVKAAFIFNFTQFVEWPVNAFPGVETPLTIGILGDDPFQNYLQEIINGEKVNGHSLVIQHYKHIEEVKTCHILFINQAETDKPGQAMMSLKGRNILTVSDGENFLDHGGIIRFITRDNKIQIQINTGAAKEANLTISSKLLRIAELVSPKNE